MREYNYRFERGLNSGLRTTDKNRRGVQALVEASGGVPFDGALNSLPELDELDLSSLSPAPSFPFPQIFVLKKTTLICTETRIYERDPLGNLSLVLSGLTSGIRWTVADFHYFIVATNGKQMVFRHGETKQWTTNNLWALPVPGTSVLNYRGQLIITAPDQELSEAELPIPNLDFSQVFNSQYLQVGIY